MGITSLETGGLTLPQGHERARAAGHAPAPPERRRTLLVVEDNEDLSLMLRTWLEAGGYEVTTAGDGWEAVQSALHNRYDAVLMDMSLPTMDGMAALRLIRAHEELRGLPVVAITAYDVAYPRAEAAEAMCDEYMVKPVDFGRLEAVLRRILG